MKRRTVIAWAVVILVAASMLLGAPSAALQG